MKGVCSDQGKIGSPSPPDRKTPWKGRCQAGRGPVRKILKPRRQVDAERPLPLPLLLSAHGRRSLGKKA